MFTTFLKELSGYFDRRWLLSAFFPSLAFWAAALLVYGTAQGLDSTFEAWRKQPAELQATLTVAGLSGVAFFASMLHNFQTGLIRLFEGYWERYPLFSWWGKVRRGHYQAQLRYLLQETRRLSNEIMSVETGSEASTEIQKARALQLREEQAKIDRERLLFYPPDEAKVMPTRLGNILRAAELYAWKRYGVDAVVLWPRLQPFLPDGFVNTLRDAKTAMDFMLVMAALSFTFALIVCILLAAFTTQWLLFLLCALGFPLAWLCYENSLHSARSYGELIKTAFDLHRWKILEGLHIQRPTSYQEEIKIWEDISSLLYRGYEPVTARYEGAKPEPTTRRSWLATLWEKIHTIWAVTAEAVVPEAEASTTEPVAQPRPRDYLGFSYLGVTAAICLAVAYWISQRPVPTIAVPVTSRDLPPYHLIAPADLTLKPIEAVRLPPDALREDSTIINHYTLQAISAGSVIRQGQIEAVSNLSWFTGTIAIGIPATPAMVLGGNLRAGDVVDLILVPAKAEAQSPPSPVLFENILVLDVRPLPESQATGSKPSDHQFVVVIALPLDRRLEFATKSPGAALVITRKP